MSHEISRMFASAATANKAAAELREEGFGEVHVVSPPAASDVPLSAIAAQIAQGHVLLADARIYAKGVAAGGSLVTVHAPFGSGVLAETILGSHEPIASGMSTAPDAPMWDDAAPLSSIMYMPVLLNDADPVSKVIGLPAITSGNCSLSETIGLPLLTSSDMPDRGRLGFKYLLNNPTPLSSLLGLPVLKEFRPWY